MKRLIGCMAVLCLLALTVGCGGSASSSTLAYVSNSTGTGFTVFSVNNNGTLTTASISPQAIGFMPKVLAITPDGKFAYFLDNSDSGLFIHGFTRAGNGTLTGQITGSPFLLNSAGSSLVISPNKPPTPQFLYVALTGTKELAIFFIDSNGTLSQVGSSPTAAPITQLAMAPDGLALYGLVPTLQEVVSFFLDPSGGSATNTNNPGSVGIEAPDNGMILSADGSFLYVLDKIETDSYTTNGSVNNSPVSFTGQSPRIRVFSTKKNGSEGNLLLSSEFHENADLTPLTQTPPASPQFPTNPVAGASSSDGRWLFIANQGSHNISVFNIHTVPGTPLEVRGSVTTGASTASPFDCGCTTPAFIAVSKLNNAIYVLDSNAAKIFQFAVDQNTGRLRALSPPSVSLAASSNCWPAAAVRRAPATSPAPTRCTRLTYRRRR